jgi:predicted DNA-binding mobile mystery protein A
LTNSEGGILDKGNLNRLKRQQVDELVVPYAAVPVRYPKAGWIRTLRTALGMTMKQLGRRLNGTTKQAVAQLEKNEVSGALTLAKLRAAADAMDCDVIIALRPRAGSIEKAVRQQAMRKVESIHSGVVHTMALEAQTEGLDDARDIAPEIQWWLTQNSARLWD